MTDVATTNEAFAIAYPSVAARWRAQDVEDARVRRNTWIVLIGVGALAVAGIALALWALLRKRRRDVDTPVVVPSLVANDPNAAPLVLTGGVTMDLPIDVVVTDQGGMTYTNAGVVTVPVAGTYAAYMRVDVRTLPPADNGTRFGGRFIVNGTTQYGSNSIVLVENEDRLADSFITAAQIPMQAGDTLEFSVTSDITMTVPSGRNELALTLIAAT